MDKEAATKLLQAIHMDEKKIPETINNKKLFPRLVKIIELAGGKAEKAQGALLYNIASEKIFPPTQERFMKDFVGMIMSNKWKRELQITEAVKFNTDNIKKKGDSYVINMPEFETATGVGVVVTEQDYDNFIEQAFQRYEAEIKELQHAFQFEKKFTGEFKALQKWADMGIFNQKLKAKKLAALGEDTGNKKGKGKMTAEQKKDLKAGAQKEEDAPASSGKDLLELVGRDCGVGMNTQKHQEEHIKFTGGAPLTRFPPEPNGYLHIGHAKAMRFNFVVAKENGGKTYLRYDDTNPCKENHEFIDHIRQSVEWLGWKPWKVTYSSDYFDQLYDLAIQLIKDDKAYVCHQSAEEMKECRNSKKDSPFRTRSVEENLKLFNHMKQGRFEEGECCLRVKMDMQHENPNLRDFVAYRIRYVPHPMTGDKWCIYPTYDYTHCTVDSLENISHSLCTLEFEIRRESYYRLLQDMKIYKPYVWEYSRLNISNTILSKRYIERLVQMGQCSGWNDPRLLTLEGLKCRGYTPTMLNDFCAHIGVSRKGNENLTSYKLLETFARKESDRLAPRTFGIMDPLLLEIVNLEVYKDTKCKGFKFPADESKGSQTFTLTKNVYIDQEDFLEEHNPKSYGLTPQQAICLKYGPFVEFVECVKNPDGSINHVKVKILPNFDNSDKKVKGFLHWVSKEHSLNVTCNLYQPHFLVEDIKKEMRANDDPKNKDKWIDFINPDSLVVRPNAKIWNIHKGIPIDSRFQFERVGYFVLTKESNPKKGKYVFNRIVELKESKLKEVKKELQTGKKK